MGFVRVIATCIKDAVVTTFWFVYHIVWFKNVQIKNPTVLTNGGASVFYLIINLSGRYRIANVICMVYNMSIYVISIQKGGAVK